MEAWEEIKENPVRYIKSMATNLVVVLVAFAYILYQMVSLQVTELNPLILLASSAVSIICGVVIKQALGENGFSKGYNSDKWDEEYEKYKKVCNDANEYVDKEDEYNAMVEKEEREKYRRNNLRRRMMKYDMWFDENGDYIGTTANYKKLKFLQKITLKKCIKVKIYTLSLFNEYDASVEQYTKKEMTDRRLRRKNATKNATSAIIVSIVGVYFLPVITNWSWASLISSTMQVALWVILGISQMYANYNFVTQDKVAILGKKKEHIVRMTNIYSQKAIKNVKTVSQTQA